LHVWAVLPVIMQWDPFIRTSRFIRDSIRDFEIDSFTVTVTRVTGFGYRSHFTLLQ
jgi:hypothetical protein